MSDPFCDFCVYCGSPNVLDDAWFCDRHECYVDYQNEEQARFEYEQRTPLTHEWAFTDLSATKASVWGYFVGQIDDSAEVLRKLLQAD